MSNNSTGFEQWSKAASVKPNQFSTSIRNLNDGQQYLFRILAKNGTGLSPATTLTEPVLVKEQVSPPDAELDGLLQKVVEGKAGNCVTAEVREFILDYSIEYDKILCVIRFGSKGNRCL